MRIRCNGESASSLMGFTVPYIGAEYIHPNSVKSALNSWLLDSFHVEIYLITDCYYLLFIYWGRWKEGGNGFMALKTKDLPQPGQKVTIKGKTT